MPRPRVHPKKSPLLAWNRKKEWGKKEVRRRAGVRVFSRNSDAKLYYQRTATASPPPVLPPEPARALLYPRLGPQPEPARRFFSSNGNAAISPMKSERSTPLPARQPQQTLLLHFSKEWIINKEGRRRLVSRTSKPMISTRRTQSPYPPLLTLDQASILLLLLHIIHQPTPPAGD